MDRETTMKLCTPVSSVLSAAAAASALPADAQSIVVDAGRGRIGEYVVVSRSNDRSSVCDEHINPNALRVLRCTTTDRGVGDRWSASFADGGGLLAGVGVEVEIVGPRPLAASWTESRQTADRLDAGHVVPISSCLLSDRRRGVI